MLGTTLSVCDQQGASAEDQKDEIQLVPRPQHNATDGSLVAAIWIGVPRTSAVDR